MCKTNQKNNKNNNNNNNNDNNNNNNNNDNDDDDDDNDNDDDDDDNFSTAISYFSKFSDYLPRYLWLFLLCHSCNYFPFVCYSTQLHPYSTNLRVI